MTFKILRRPHRCAPIFLFNRLHSMIMEKPIIIQNIVYKPTVLVYNEPIQEKPSWFDFVIVTALIVLKLLVEYI